MEKKLWSLLYHRKKNWPYRMEQSGDIQIFIVSLLMVHPVTVGIFGLSRRTCNFCALKRACFAQKWSYITHKTTFKKIKHFFEKKIFDEKYLGVALTLIFSRKVFCSKMFCAIHHLTQFHALIPNITLFFNKNIFLTVKNGKYLQKNGKYLENQGFL